MELRRQTAFNTFHATGLPLKNLKSWQARRNRGSWWAAAPPPTQIFAKFDLLPIGNYSEKKKVPKNV